MIGFEEIELDDSVPYQQNQSQHPPKIQTFVTLDIFSKIESGTIAKLMSSTCRYLPERDMFG